MLNNLLSSLSSYLFFREIFSVLFSFLITYFLISCFIKIINQKQILRQPIRDDGPESHLKTKKNTPTMGGLMILLGTSFVTLVFGNLKNPYLLITLFIFITFSLIGLADDLAKVTSQNSRGIRGKIKLALQFIIIALITSWLKSTNPTYAQQAISLPFGLGFIKVGLLYVLFVMLVIAGSANAVNLTDGLDGLVSVPVIITLFCLSTMLYISSDMNIALKNQITAIPEIRELIIFCLALIGSVLAFLKFNIKPAGIFMGDVGSLGIGAALGAIAVILRQEIIFALIGLLFVIETFSVMIQVISFKLRKKRVFLMAPLHHHFEKLGWEEKRVVRNFWLASLIFGLIGLFSFLWPILPF